MSIMTMELIERLRQHADTFEKSGFAVDGLVKDYREAADTIQLLSEKLHASQPEPCEDAISRQAAIEQSIVLRDISNPDKEWEVVTVATLKHLKSVQPAQKVGHWVITDYEYYDCSVCGESYYNGCESRKEAEERLKMRPYDVYSFCPHCGAKMEEGE